MYKERHIAIAFFSLFFAGILWSLINLTNVFITTIQMPVDIIHLKNDKAIASHVPQFVTAKIRASGWQIMSVWLSPAIRYEIDLERTSKKNIILTNSNLADRIKQPGSLSIFDVEPDSIQIDLAPKIKRTVPVIPVTELTFKEGYDIVGTISSEPESVMIEGAEPVIDTMSGWLTSLMKYNDLKSGIAARIDLADGRKNHILISPQTVTVHFIVQETAEKKIFGIPVELSQVPDDHVITLIPPKIDIVLRGGIERIASVSTSDISAYIEYRAALLDTTGYLRPILILPKDVRAIMCTPEKIQYVIRK